MSVLEVWYQDDGPPQRVGGLALDRSGQTHFQYDGTWLSLGVELSPHQLPLALGASVVRAPDPRRSHGLQGLFSDSLPDAWGMRLLDRLLRRAGVNPQLATPLDRLAVLGSRTMGALTYRPERAPEHEASDRITLDVLAQEADVLAEGDSATISLDALERSGGSAGGAQPKALVALSADGTLDISTNAPVGCMPHVLKFTPRRHTLGLRTDCGVLEHAFASMARAAHISMPASRLLPTSDGRTHFAIARFDRTPDGGRRHVHSFGGLLGREASDDGDYDELLRVTRALTGDARALEEVLRRLCFNVAVLNDDDHVRNHAFLLDPSEGWQLAPAYDLTFAPSRAGERGMSVNGREGDITWRDISTLAAQHDLRVARVREIRDAVESAVADWPRTASASGVPQASVTELGQRFAERRRQLDSART